MREEIARSSGWDGANWQVRTEVAPERLCVEYGGSDLAKLYWYWLERSILEDSVPSLQNFRFPGGDLPWVEVNTDDPMKFVIRNHPGSLCGDWSNMRLIEHPVLIHAQSCAYEYQECKIRQYPTFVIVHQKIFNVERRYMRLTVPVSAENGAVTQVFFLSRHLQFQIIFGGVR